jgi:acetyl-CoA synthetase
MVHTTAGYMVYNGLYFKNVFNYEENDIFWCTADIGLLTFLYSLWTFIERCYH